MLLNAVYTGENSSRTFSNMLLKGQNHHTPILSEFKLILYSSVPPPIISCCVVQPDYILPCAGQLGAEDVDRGEREAGG